MSECEACRRADATVEAEFKGREILWNGQEPWQRTIGEMVTEHHAEIERLRGEIAQMKADFQAGAKIGLDLVCRALTDSSTERRER